VSNRYLVVNADDLGLSAGVNAGIAEAHDRGIVTSASLMVLQPAAAEAAAWAAARPELAVGIHLDLCEWRCRDDEWELRYQRVDLEDEAAVEAEVRRQLDRFRDLVGRAPTHVDSHQHVHRDGCVAAVTDRVARELGVALRDAGGVRYVGTFYGQSGKGYPLPELVSAPALIEVLSSLEEGWSEIGCHPGYADDLDDMYAVERKLEVESLCEPAVSRFLDETGIALRSFADWNAANAASTSTSAAASAADSDGFADHP
jgi:predicted glycoside hydrolase/deacetylase ChbG (UPF0249 family)